MPIRQAVKPGSCNIANTASSAASLNAVPTSARRVGDRQTSSAPRLTSAAALSGASHALLTCQRKVQPPCRLKQREHRSLGHARHAVGDNLGRLQDRTSQIRSTATGAAHAVARPALPPGPLSCSMDPSGSTPQACSQPHSLAVQHTQACTQARTHKHIHKRTCASAAATPSSSAWQQLMPPAKSAARRLNDTAAWQQNSAAPNTGLPPLPLLLLDAVLVLL